MDDFLTPVSTTKVNRTPEAKSLVQEVQTIVEEQNTVDSPARALETLKEQPDFDSVADVLKYLASESERNDGFHLLLPDPIAANIAYQLINTTIPDYWQTIKTRRALLKQMITCLRNPCAVGNIITKLRPLLADCQQKKTVGDGRESTAHIVDLLDVLEELLSGDGCFSAVWFDVITHSQNPAQRRMIWKEFIGQAASGRIISLVAEAEDVLKAAKNPRTPSWLADGSGYASWLGRNIANLLKGYKDDDSTALAAVDLCSKALTLGYTDQIVHAMLLAMIESESIGVFRSLLAKLKAFEQRKFLNAIITSLAKDHIETTASDGSLSSLDSSPRIAGAAALICDLIQNNQALKEHLVTSLTKSAIPALDDSLGARRSIVAALAKDEDQLHTLLENSLKMFGDNFYIKHTPILQQQALAQTLALTCGYVQRSQPMFMTMMAKSSYHTNGTSNRIGASSPAARFLGMALGMMISAMVDGPETRLKFELEGEEAAQAQWYQHLAEVNDQLGRVSDLKVQTKRPSKQKTQKPSSKSASQRPSQPTVTEIQGPRIVEIMSDDENSEDDDLVPYSKPDSDPEDDTEDPTEINRNKPTAPVYVRDLVAGLRDTENYDRHVLALSTAATLIRRKANFGSEVLDHIEELATILVGLNDNFELEQFAEQRQQALIAILMAKPAAMAQWFARSFFAGDYSLTQRTVMLTTLGLGARELAGMRDSTPTDDTLPSKSFPSKKLPPHLHAVYDSASPSSAPLARVTANMTKQLLSPLAAQAADTLTGPAILKVGQSRTFSSRMEVEARRSKPIPNALSQMVAENFFFPLTGRWWLAARSSTSNSSIYTSTHLLPTFLHTLALLMNASGPNTLSLPQMTRELWELLLSCRAYALDDRRILSALLFALMMLLETNADKERLATEQGKELMETQEWVRTVFEGLPAGKDGEEDEKVRVLAAGVVVRCQEIVEKYQRRLVGSLMDY